MLVPKNGWSNRTRGVNSAVATFSSLLSARAEGAVGSTKHAVIGVSNSGQIASTGLRALFLWDQRKGKHSCIQSLLKSPARALHILHILKSLRGRAHAYQTYFFLSFRFASNRG